jgi:anaerobic selenocysteine-containing dehydrogenase
MDIKAGDIVVKGACPHDCPDTCALQVTVRDGRAIRVAGDPDHPTTRGVLCTKVSRYTERTYHPDRVLTPLRRVGPKGSGRFEPVGWDEALDAIAARLQAIAARDPQRILPYSHGTMAVQGEGWLRASSTASAPRGWIARSARAPAWRGWSTRWAQRWEWTLSASSIPG